MGLVAVKVTKRLKLKTLCPLGHENLLVIAIFSVDCLWT